MKENKSALLWFIFIIFLLGSVFFTIQTSTSGAVLVNLEDNAAILSKENEALKREVSKTTSLRAVEEKASEMGLAKPKLVIYITDEESVAKLQ